MYWPGFDDGGGGGRGEPPWKNGGGAITGDELGFGICFVWVGIQIGVETTRKDSKFFAFFG